MNLELSSSPVPFVNSCVYGEFPPVVVSIPTDVPIFSFSSIPSVSPPSIYISVIAALADEVKIKSPVII